MSPVQPPIDFQLFGLDASWTGPRWLDFSEGNISEPSLGIWLAHSERWPPSPGARWARVGAFPKQRYVEAVHGRDAERELAFAALFALVNLTTQESARADVSAWEMVDRAEDMAAEVGTWPQVRWTVEGTEVPARVSRWADAWAGLTTAIDDVALVVVGGGFEPSDVILTRVIDGAPYHVDLDAPMTLPDTLDASRRAALGAIDPV